MSGSVVKGECVGVRFLWFVLCGGGLFEPPECEDVEVWAYFLLSEYRRNDLLRVLGCSRVCLWRWLCRLGELGLVRLDGKRILVKNRADAEASWGRVVGEIRTEQNIGG